MNIVNIVTVKEKIKLYKDNEEANNIELILFEENGFDRFPLQIHRIIWSTLMRQLPFNLKFQSLNIIPLQTNIGIFVECEKAECLRRLLLRIFKKMR